MALRSLLAMNPLVNSRPVRRLTPRDRTPSAPMPPPPQIGGPKACGSRLSLGGASRGVTAQEH